MSAIRRIARPPLYARISERGFLRWAARATESRRLASLGERSVIFPPALIIGHERIHIGSGVIVHPGAFFSVVGEEAGRRFEGRLVIGDGTRIGFDMVIACC